MILFLAKIIDVFNGKESKNNFYSKMRCSISNLAHLYYFFDKKKFKKIIKKLEIQ